MGKKQFFKVNVSDVEAGVFKGWTAKEFKAWFVLKRRENHSTHIAYPGYKDFHNLAGLSKNSVTEAIRLLESRGVIEVLHQRGRVNIYHILL
jgi:DNA-binding MarR family transcriptional regulator